MLIEREIACDETAVAVTGCPKRYAACLTTIAGLPPAAIEQMGAMGVLSTPALSRRVMRILSSRTLASRTWSASAALAAILLLSAFSFALAGHRLVEVTGAASQVVARPDDSRSLPAKAGSHTGDSPSRVASAPPSPLVASAFRRKEDDSRSLPALRQAQGRPELRRRTASQLPLKLRRSAEALAKAEAGRGHSVTAPLAHRSAEREGGALVPVAASSRTLPAIDTPALLWSRVQVPDSGSSPWAAIADGGVSVGRGSRQAGVATARFFTRFGKKIAGSL
jgi:hypothetical protein